jgi:transketolase
VKSAVDDLSRLATRIRLPAAHMVGIQGFGYLGQALSAAEISGRDACIVASGMMVPAALVAADVLDAHGISACVVNSPVVKPLDAATIVEQARRARVVVTAENHSVIGGLGSAVAEALAEAGVGVPLRRIGLADVFAESGSREYLFDRYNLCVQNIVDAAWTTVSPQNPIPAAPSMPATPGTYAPV